MKGNNPFSKFVRSYVLVIMGIVAVIAIIGGVVMAMGLQTSYTGYEITWLGDTLLGDAAEPYLLENSFRWAFAQVPDIYRSNLTVMNLEGPITGITKQWFTDQKWSYNSLPQAAKAIAELGVDVVSVGNNHALDRGPAGLIDTVEAMQAVGISTIGAGLNADAAAKPFITNTPHGRVGIFAFAEPSPTALEADENAGIFALSIDNVRAAQTAARAAEVDWLVAFVHWHVNYSNITSNQRQWARCLADSGFNLVVGTGPHNPQAIEVIGHTPVVYSIGNFVFGTPGRWSEEYPGIGLMVTTVLGPRGFREIRIECLQTDNQVVEYQPRPCDLTTTRQVLESLYPRLDIEGTTGIIYW